MTERSGRWSRCARSSSARRASIAASASRSSGRASSAACSTVSASISACTGDGVNASATARRRRRQRRFRRSMQEGVDLRRDDALPRAQPHALVEQVRLLGLGLERILLRARARGVARGRHAQQIVEQSRCSSLMRSDSASQRVVDEEELGGASELAAHGFELASITLSLGGGELRPALRCARPDRYAPARPRPSVRR